MGSRKIKQALRDKLSFGWTLEDACEQLGLSVAQGEIIAKDILKKSTLDDSSLHILAFDALRCGIEKLKDIVKAGPRYSDVGGEGGNKVESVDLVAAKALVDSGIKIRALIGKTKEKAAELDAGKEKTGQPDLWDLYGPWDLKKPEDF